MSDILIKGMKMPTCCYKCPVRRRDGMDLVCTIAHERFSVAGVNILEYRLDNCPLVPVPPHGRLIQDDALDKIEHYHDGSFGLTDYERGWNAALLLCKKRIEAAPTIIPADKDDAR